MMCHLEKKMSLHLGIPTHAIKKKKRIQRNSYIWFNFENSVRIHWQATWKYLMYHQIKNSDRSPNFHFYRWENDAQSCVSAWYKCLTSVRNHFPPKMKFNLFSKYIKMEVVWFKPEMGRQHCTSRLHSGIWWCFWRYPRNPKLSQKPLKTTGLDQDYLSTQQQI